MFFLFSCFGLAKVGTGQEISGLGGMRSEMNGAVRCEKPPKSIEPGFASWKKDISPL